MVDGNGVPVLIATLEVASVTLQAVRENVAKRTTRRMKKGRWLEQERRHPSRQFAPCLASFPNSPVQTKVDDSAIRIVNPTIATPPRMTGPGLRVPSVST